jgi:large subunit ribosomal protein L17
VPHQVHQRKFGRESSHRRAMLRNLTLSVLRYEKVKTTEAKAKEVRGFVDKMINLGKDGSLASRRAAIAWLPEAAIVEKVFSDLAPRYPDRRSGYARMVRLAPRVGDSAPTALLELLPAVVDEPPAEEEKPRRRLSLPGRAKKAAAPAKAAKATKAAKAAKATKKVGAAGK